MNEFNFLRIESQFTTEKLFVNRESFSTLTFLQPLNRDLLVEAGTSRNPCTHYVRRLAMGAQSRPWLSSHSAKRRAFSGVMSGPGSVGARFVAVGQPASPRFLMRTGRASGSVFTSSVMNCIFSWPFTHTMRSGGAGRPSSARAIRFSLTACSKTVLAISCGKPWPAKAKPWWRVWKL